MTVTISDNGDLLCSFDFKYLREHGTHCTRFSVNALSYTEIYRQPRARGGSALTRVSVQGTKVLGML